MSVAKSPQMPDIEFMTTRLRTLSIATSLAVVALGMSASSASAGLLVASAPDCTPKPTTQPFKQFGDSTPYNLAPGGSSRVVRDRGRWPAAPRS